MARLAVVCCTRNRASQAQRLAREIDACSEGPDIVVVIDSSDEPLVPPKIGTPLLIFRSSPGLPHQRNVGIDAVLNLGIENIVFLDDDVSISDNFFEVIRTALAEHPNGLIGGVDIAPLPLISRLYRGFLGIRGLKGNRLTRSADAIMGIPPGSPMEVDWVPGFVMAARTESFSQVRFSESIRMIGEDIEFQLRWQETWPIVLEPRLRLLHLSEPRGRLSAALITEKWNWFRISMAETYPKRFNKARVILSAAFLAIVSMGALRFPAFLGHLKFLSSFTLRRAPNLDSMPAKDA